MVRKRFGLYAALTSIVAAAVIALAGQVSFAGVSFSYGSLAATGDLRGLGNVTYTVTNAAVGNAEIACRNAGGTISPGQFPAQWTSSGSTSVTPSGDGKSSRNGRSPFGASAPSPAPGSTANLSARAAGCPNDNWTAVYTGFVYWTGATLTATSSDGTDTATQSYACTTTRLSATSGNVSCRRI